MNRYSNILQSTLMSMAMSMSWVGALLLAAAVSSAHAQKPANLPGGYPNKSIKILIPLAAGGGVDTLARTVGQKLGERWGVGVVVDNQPSAGGVLAMNMLAQAAPDGYTLLSTGSQMELVTVYYRAGWNKDKPGIAESGMPEFEMSNAYGLFGTGKIPAAILNAINKEVTEVLFLPELKARFMADGAEPQPSHTPAQYRAKLERNAARWASVVESSGIKPE